MPLLGLVSRDNQQTSCWLLKWYVSACMCVAFICVDRETGRQMDGQTGSQMDVQTDRQTNSTDRRTNNYVENESLVEKQEGYYIAWILFINQDKQGKKCILLSLPGAVCVWDFESKLFHSPGDCLHTTQLGDMPAYRDVFHPILHLSTSPCYPCRCVSWCPSDPHYIFTCKRVWCGLCWWKLLKGVWF